MTGEEEEEEETCRKHSLLLYLTDTEPVIERFSDLFGLSCDYIITLERKLTNSEQSSQMKASSLQF